MFAGATLDGFPELYGSRLLRHRDSIIDFSFFFHFSFHFPFSFSSTRTARCCYFLFFFFVLRLLASFASLYHLRPSQLCWQRTSTCMQSDTICIEECAYRIWRYIYIHTYIPYIGYMSPCVCVCVLLLFVTFQQLLSRATARGTRQEPAAKN